MKALAQMAVGNVSVRSYEALRMGKFAQLAGKNTLCTEITRTAIDGKLLHLVVLRC